MIVIKFGIWIKYKVDNKEGENILFYFEKGKEVEKLFCWVNDDEIFESVLMLKINLSILIK